MTVGAQAAQERVEVHRLARRIPSLDGLRAISIALVIGSHIVAQLNVSDWAKAIAASYGNFGVRVFFVISGYLITRMLLEEQSQYGTIRLKRFYIRRAFRILPAAYIYIFVITIICWRKLALVDIGIAAVYLKNFSLSKEWYLGHLWSLSVEEQFYLLWPLLLSTMFAFRVRIAVFAAVIAFAVRIWLSYVGLYTAGNYFPAVFDAIGAGCLLAILQIELNRKINVVASRWMLVPISLTCLLPTLSRHPHLYFSVVISAMNCGVAIAVGHCVERGYGFLNMKPLIATGVLSYSLYLWQQPFLNPSAHRRWMLFPLNLVLASCAAILSYYLVEQPALRLRERWEKGFEARRKKSPVPEDHLHNPSGGQIPAVDLEVNY